MILHFESNDPNGNALYASPANALIIALPYHGAVLLTTAAVLLALWKLLPPLRPAVTGLGIVVALTTIVIGQVDLAMQWFVGQRFVPTVAGTYIGGSMISSDLYAPLLFHPVYFAIGLALILVPAAVIGRSVILARRAKVVRRPNWLWVAGLLVLAVSCRAPIRWAYDHQRDFMRPPELVFAYHWLRPTTVAPPSDEAAAVAQLRAAVDPTGTSEWLDPKLPLLRAASNIRDRFPVGVAPSERPDIFVFAVESLRGADVGYVPGNYPPGESPTPRLDQLARGAVVFSHYISNGNPSPRGFFAINSGVWDHREYLNVTGSIATEFDALPGRLRGSGYFTLALWGSNPSFDNQLFWALKWYDRMRYPVPAARFVITQTLADDIVMDQLIEEVSAHDRKDPAQPLFAYIATDGTHVPYTVRGETKLSATAVRAIAAEPDPRSRYRLVLHNFDTQIGRVLDFLATRPATRPCIIIVIGDHGDAAGDTIPSEMRGLPHNGVEWTSALIAGPSALIGPVPRVETFASSHVDLTPTVLDLVGDHRATASLGTDLFVSIPPERRTALSISGEGYRLDRNGWSLFVRREQPDAIFTKLAFAPIASFHPGVSGSPFTADDARRLWENMNTWSFILEQNRLWRPAVLGDRK